MPSTKDKIVDQARQIFNKSGYNAVSLHELATTIGMSRGNLTYHFKTKDALLQAIADQMWDRINEQRAKSRRFPSFENLHNESRLLYATQKKYEFIFLNNAIWNHPALYERFLMMTAQSIRDNQAAIAFAIELGNVKQESVPGTYDHLAFLTWLVSFYWLSQELLTGRRGEKECERAVWSMLLPHFTNKGIKSFIRFFGEEFYRGLGMPFDKKIQSYLSL